MADPQTTPRDDFYVGYLATPPSHLRFARRLVWGLLAWIILLGAVIAASMRSPGETVWNTAQEQTWTGTLFTDPYPMLVPADGTMPLLIVEMGKHGAHARVEPHAGRSVDVRGFLLERDARRIIELTPDDRAIVPVNAPLTAAPTPTTPTPVTLTGEIVDGKCYLGAMKPGDGLTHKACATLCVRGGLPPMFVSQEDGRTVFRLLVVDGSTTLPDHIIALIAEPVRIEGERAEVGGLPILSTTADRVLLAR